MHTKCPHCTAPVLWVDGLRETAPERGIWSGWVYQPEVPADFMAAVRELREAYTISDTPEFIRKELVMKSVRKLINMLPKETDRG